MLITFISQLKDLPNPKGILLIPGDHACAAAWDAATDGNDERGRPTVLLQTAQGRSLGVATWKQKQNGSGVK